MEPETPPTVKRPFPVRGCLLVFGGLVVIMVLVLAVGGRLWCARSARLVQEEFARIREAGEPVTGDELNDFYALGENQTDCTQLWLRALRTFEGPAYYEASEHIPIVGPNDKEIPPLGEPWADQAITEEFLKKYAGSMKLMHEAARQGGAARYPIDLRDLYNASLPHVQQVRQGMRMLHLEAHVRARQGDPHAAAESIRTMIRLAESTEREPLLVSQLVRMACHRIARDLTAELLPDVDFSDEDLARLQADFAAIRYDDAMHRAMIGERVWGIQGFEDPAAVLGNDNPKFRLGPRNDDLLLYLDFMDEAVAVAKLSGPKRLAAALQCANRMQQFFDDANVVTKARHPHTTVFTPAIAAAFAAEARNEAQNRSVVALIAIERYRRKHDELPENLEQLVPEFLDEVPVDPFDGQPLRYIIRDGKPILYSVGMDQFDDGGQGDSDGEPDILFPRPPYEEQP